jgi:ISXO2-like transposase domain
LKGAPGRGTLEKEKPPVFGMVQRTGEVAIRMLADVKQRTIGPLIKTTVVPGSVVYTDGIWLPGPGRQLGEHDLKKRFNLSQGFRR